jgi:hypothetical protein
MIEIEGRPDFEDHSFGKTYAKRFPPYVYSRKGALIHKVVSVQIRWWQGCYDKMVRQESPTVIAETACGMSKFINAGGPGERNRMRAVVCTIPSPIAVMCGRCHGEGANFKRDDRQRRKKLMTARANLGCVALEDRPGAHSIRPLGAGKEVQN